MARTLRSEGRLQETQHLRQPHLVAPKLRARRGSAHWTQSPSSLMKNPSKRSRLSKASSSSSPNRRALQHLDPRESRMPCLCRPHKRHPKKPSECSINFAFVGAHHPHNLRPKGCVPSKHHLSHPTPIDSNQTPFYRQSYETSSPSILPSSHHCPSTPQATVVQPRP